MNTTLSIIAILVILLILYYLFQHDVNRVLERIKYRLTYLKLRFSRSLIGSSY